MTADCCFPRTGLTARGGVARSSLRTVSSINITTPSHHLHHTLTHNITHLLYHHFILIFTSCIALFLSLTFLHLLTPSSAKSIIHSSTQYVLHFTIDWVMLCSLRRAHFFTNFPLQVLRDFGFVININILHSGQVLPQQEKSDMPFSEEKPNIGQLCACLAKEFFKSVLSFFACTLLYPRKINR